MIKVKEIDVTLLSHAETKTILGYECQRYDVVVKQGQEVKMIVYATDKLNYSYNKDATFGDKIERFSIILWK